MLGFFVVPNKVDDFVGPRFGTAGFKSTDELSDTIFTRYQSALDSSYDDFIRLESQGLIEIPAGVNRRTYLGQFIDRAARTDITDYARAQGVEDFIDINRRLYSPDSTSYRIPDLRLPNSNLIYDATIAPKNINTPQVRDFFDFTNGGRVTIVRPVQEGGSYSILNY